MCGSVSLVSPEVKSNRSCPEMLRGARTGHRPWPPSLMAPRAPRLLEHPRGRGRQAALTQQLQTHHVLFSCECTRRGGPLGSPHPGGRLGPWPPAPGKRTGQDPRIICLGGVVRLEDSWHDFYKSEIMAQPVQGLGDSRLQALPSLLQKNAAWLVEDRQPLGTPGSAPSSQASPVKRRVWAGFVHRGGRKQMP